MTNNGTCPGHKNSVRTLPFRCMVSRRTISVCCHARAPTTSTPSSRTVVQTSCWKRWDVNPTSTMTENTSMGITMPIIIPATLPTQNVSTTVTPDCPVRWAVPRRDNSPWRPSRVNIATVATFMTSSTRYGSTTGRCAGLVATRSGAGTGSETTTRWQHYC